MRLLFIAIATTVFFTNCAKKQSKEVIQTIVFFNNAEPNNWASSQTIKKSDITHSGNFVSVIDSISPYSLGINKVIKDISYRTLDSVTFTYWVFLKNLNTPTTTVYTIEGTDGKAVEWLGVPVKNKVKVNNKWTQVSETFKITANTNPENTIKLFVWNTSKEEVLLDDFKITFY